MSFCDAPGVHAAGRRFFSYPASVDSRDSHRPLSCWCVVAFVCGLLGVSNASGGFSATPSYVAGIKPWTIAVADFNGDGIPDLAVANLGDGTNGGDGDSHCGVSILIGNGDGTFRPPQSQVFGQAIYDVMAIDLNLDGIPDIAVSGIDISGYPTTIVFLGNGDGTFRRLPGFRAGLSAIGDFNGDGIPDLMGNDDPGLAVWLGNGDGTFQPPKEVPGINGGPVVVADFNGDGALDVVLIGGRILLGNGDGTFQPPQRFAVPPNPVFAAVADFNGDGMADLAVASVGDGTGINAGVSILLGNGDGTFQAPRFYICGGWRSGLAVGDFNADGQLDVALADAYTVNVFLGNGDGTLQAPILYAADAAPTTVAVADFNGDGNLDVAVANAGVPGSVSILLGNGNGTFRAARSYWSGGSTLGFTSAATADFNNDGIPDLVVTNSADGTATILFGNGDGSFQLGQTYVAGGSPIVVADVNGDGIPDLVVLAGVLLGNGNGTFQPLLAFSAGEGPNSLAVADFNGDGILDIVTTNFGVGGDPRHPVVTENGVRILLGNGDGTFQAAQPIAIQPSDSRPAFVVVGDWNHDGNVDLAVASAESGTLTILLGKGDGTFQVGRTYTVGAGLAALAVADLNGDGQLDLVAANTGTFLVFGKLTVFLGKGDGTFQPGHTYPIAPRPYTLSVAVGDFNHDGIADVVVADGSGARVFLGNGDGTLQAAQVYAAGSGGDLVVADWNGDGLPDLALSNSATILLNQP